ncbi:response regulator transcription factor [Winogradskya humida]|uniref:DNA-binding response regulator n=1 Tax=Winogradskya humida TaxID=113566 RepID=A0ABQ3ZPW7_9ACTN|nr:response regulator transcription factor [Actinoplanes humidus]GIE20607.1 DNA-binding response regulator [Actinoplanes humidus]
MTRVVLAEDGVLLREGLVSVLARFGFDVVAAVSDAEELVAVVAEHHPDLVITDIRMPPTFRDEGLQAAVALRRLRPDLPIVVLSQYVQADYATTLLSTGDGRAVGYLLKDRVADVQDFAKSLQSVTAGATVIDPEVVRRLLHRPPDPLTTLSTREREVLSLVAEGHSNSAIATRLFITEAAITKHVGNILTKLNLPPTDQANRRVLAVLRYLRA